MRVSHSRGPRRPGPRRRLACELTILCGEDRQDSGRLSSKKVLRHEALDEVMRRSRPTRSLRSLSPQTNAQHRCALADTFRTLFAEWEASVMPIYKHSSRVDLTIPSRERNLAPGVSLLLNVSLTGRAG
jgi:hypothetical protein